MISQLLSKAKLPSIFDRDAAAPGATVEGGDSGKTGGFSSLFTALGGPHGVDAASTISPDG